MIELYRNGRKVDFDKIVFPANEVHFKIKQLEMNGIHNLNESWEIITDIKDSEELMLVILLADYIGNDEKKLTLLYTPYARQDRKTHWSEPFSFKTFARLINSCGFDEVKIYDPHSDVTPALLNNVIVDKCNVFEKITSIPDILVSPDAGAMKKNNALAMRWSVPHIIATKERDVTTGEITETKIHTDLSLEGKKLLIVDDICDGGRTFIELAKVLRKHKPKEINLFVTVGIFSQGYDKVKEHFDNINYFHRKEI